MNDENKNIYCAGRKCAAVNGYGHSLECIDDHDNAAHFGAGNRNPESRYRGYKDESLPDGASKDQKAAWTIGNNAKTNRPTISGE